MSERNNYGENLAWITGMRLETAIERAIEEFYNQIRSYNRDDPFSRSYLTSHFTQVSANLFYSVAKKPFRWSGEIRWELGLDLHKWTKELDGAIGNKVDG